MKSQQTRLTIFGKKPDPESREIPYISQNGVRVSAVGKLPVEQGRKFKGTLVGRRRVWKDAKKYDITCIVATPCSTPSRTPFVPFGCNPIRRTNDLRDTPALSNTASSPTPNFSDNDSNTPEPNTENVRNPNLNPYFNSNGHSNSSEGQNHQWIDSVMATIDDAAEGDADHEGGGTDPQHEYQTHSRIFSNPIAHAKSTKQVFQPKRGKIIKRNDSHYTKEKTEKPLLKHRETPRTLQQSHSQCRPRLSTNCKPLGFSNNTSHSNHPNNLSLDISAAVSSHSNMRVSHKIAPMKLKMIQSGSTSHSSKKREHLQHFDVKGIQTLLFDGILSTIQKTLRFRTLNGTKSNVMTQLQGPDAPKVLHYIGHAEDGKLLVESDTDIGLRDWVDPKKHTILGAMTQCVVIQSPNHMEVAEIFLSMKPAPKHVIAIKQLEDNFAHHVIDFVHQFYYALIEGKTTIARAFATGLQMFGNDGELIARRYRSTIERDFRLLPETDGYDHELILFDSKSKFVPGPPTNFSEKLAPHSYLLAVRPFIGRWPEVYIVMNMIRSKRLSLICSHREGCGRTAIITMAARYLWERSKFEGGVFHIKHVLNFQGQSEYSNIVDLVLAALSNADVEGYRQVLAFYESDGQSVLWRENSLLAVELIRRYVHRLDGSSHPVCLLLSDFDELKFAEEDKFRFVCAFIKQFETETLAPNQQIGSRLVLTANFKMLEKLHRFMSDDYARNRSLRLQPHFGYRVVAPLSDDELVNLFAQMIRITSSDAAYTRKDMSRHRAFKELLHPGPLRVKQVAEFALQTFDNNLSKQQFNDGDVYENLLWGIEDEDENEINEGDPDTQSDHDHDDDAKETKGNHQGHHQYVASLANGGGHANAPSLSVSRVHSTTGARSPRRSRILMCIRQGSRRSDAVRSNESTLLLENRMHSKSYTNQTITKRSTFSATQYGKAGILSPSDGDGDIYLTKRASTAMNHGLCTTNTFHVDYGTGPLDEQKTVIRQRLFQLHASKKKLEGLPGDRRRSSSRIYHQNPRSSVIAASTRMQTIRSEELADTQEADAELLRVGMRMPDIPSGQSMDLSVQNQRTSLPPAPFRYSNNHRKGPSYYRKPSNFKGSSSALEEMVEESLSPSMLSGSESSSPIFKHTAHHHRKVTLNKMDHKIKSNNARSVRSVLNGTVLGVEHGQLTPRRGHTHKRSLSSSLPSPHIPMFPVTEFSNPRMVGTQYSTGTIPDLRYQGSCAVLRVNSNKTPSSPSTSRGHHYANTSVSYSSSFAMDDFIKDAWPSLDHLVDGFKKRLKEIEDEQKEQQRLRLQQQQQQQTISQISGDVVSYHSAFGSTAPLDLDQSRTPRRQHRGGQITYTNMSNMDLNIVDDAAAGDDEEGNSGRPQQQQLRINVSPINVINEPRQKQKQRPYKANAENRSATNTPKQQQDHGLVFVRNLSSKSSNRGPSEARAYRPYITDGLADAINISNEMSFGCMGTPVMVAQEVSHSLSQPPSGGTRSPSAINAMITPCSPTMEMENVWNESGGTEKRKLSLKDVVMGLCNRCREWTQSRCRVIMDERSIAPFFVKFASSKQQHPSSSAVVSAAGPPLVSFSEFNRLWSWFDTLCAVMKDTLSFWSRPIAEYHGFVTRDMAERQLKQCKVGTFIVRFDAPKWDIIVSVKEQPNKVRHESFSDADITGQKALMFWINGTASFEYVYHESTKVVVPKKGMFLH